MANNKDIGPRFVEVSKAKISDTRNVVISKTTNGSVIMAQQLVVKEGNYTHNVFIKGAIELPSKEAIVELRDALNVCISALGE